jgi:hypothetical protein
MHPDHFSNEGPIPPGLRPGYSSRPTVRFWGAGEIIIAIVIAAVTVLISLYSLGAFDSHPAPAPKPSVKVVPLAQQRGL